MALIRLQNNSLTVSPEIGQAANQAASLHVFEDWKEGRAENTIKRARQELGKFSQFLAQLENSAPLDLFEDPHAWTGITHGLVKAFLRLLLMEGYAIGTVNLHLSTIKTFSKLATAAGALSTQERALIRDIEGYSRSRGINIDEKREDAGNDTRRGYKKAEFIALTAAQAQTLKNSPDRGTDQGKRDYVILCIFLDLGLRVGELASLTAANFNLDAGTVTFYRKKVKKTQRHELTPDTLQAVREYLQACHEGGELPLIRGSRKGGQLGKYGVSERSISDRVNFLANEALGIENLSAHDLRHTWATLAAEAGTDINDLRQAGGWSSLAMPARYIAENDKANEGVMLP